MKVVFIHPDLGIGGAEKLIVDAAAALKSKGHRVLILTSHFDKNRCFQELTSDGCLGPDIVRTYGSFIPRNIFGRFNLLCTLLRVAFCCFQVDLDTDVIFCDQTAHVLPILKMYNKPIVFYCHFPDLLLCTDRDSFFKRFYRSVFDWMEEKSTLLADLILVNSYFTAETFKRTFKSYDPKLHQPLKVLYPAFNSNCVSNLALTDQKKGFTVLSINRFERKKNLKLVIRSFYCFWKTLDAKSEAKLVIAGGYDLRVAENVEHLKELQLLVEELFGNDKSVVEFKPSFSDKEKEELFSEASVLIYSPENEHFGIVPLESMAHKVPVLAVRSGGPLETVKHGETGFLLSNSSEEFSMKLKYLYENKELCLELGENAAKRVKKHFSFEVFANELHNQVNKLEKGFKHRVELRGIMLICLALSLLLWSYSSYNYGVSTR